MPSYYAGQGSIEPTASPSIPAEVVEVSKMKIYLDDKRATPPGWKRCFWPDEVIKLLRTERVTEMSLDHDLGNDRRGTGMDVLNWLENAVADPTHPSVKRTTSLKPPKITIHSDNASAVPVMKRLAQRIHKLYNDPRFRVASRHLALKKNKKRTRHVVMDMPSTNRPPPQFNKMEPTEVLGYLRWLLLDNFEMEAAEQPLKALGRVVNQGMKSVDRWRRFNRSGADSTRVAMRHMALRGPMDCAMAGELGYRIQSLMKGLRGENPAQDYDEYLTEASHELIRLSETYEGSHSLGLPSGSSVEEEQEFLQKAVQSLLMKAFRDWRNYVEYREAMDASYKLAQDALRLVKNFDGE